MTRLHKTVTANTTLYHVGSKLTCRVLECRLDKTYSGTGEESDRAFRHADRHEARNAGHVVDVSSVYSLTPLKG